MKKMTLLGILFAATASAQTTYNSTDLATAGETFEITIAGNFATQDFVGAGANQSWDFSSLTGESTGAVSWLDPNDTGYKATWCLVHLYVFNCNSQFNAAFNLAGEFPEGAALGNLGVTNLMNHYFLADSSLESRMLGATISLNGTDIALTVDYTTPDIVYEFPINFNDNYTHTSEVAVDLSALGIPASINGATQRTNFVDGWGSVVTPAGTYANVLRMKTTLITDQLIVYEGEEIPVQTTTVTYKWLDPAYGTPVLEATGTEASSAFIPVRVTFLGQALGVKQDPFAGIHLYPNPTSGQLQLNGGISANEVSVFDALGVQVSKSLDIGNLESGMYFVKVTSNNGSFTQKIIKK